VIDTFRKLVESGDRVLRVEGCVSGTLGYVMSSLEAGTPFSTAVREAVKLGYAEPDPREDLSGADALRKGLILARLLGFSGLAPRAQNLVSKAHAKLPLATFLARLPEVDGEWRDLVAAEASRGRVLRYVVVATARGVWAGLKAVPRASPFGSLSGTRNLLSFTTRRYHTEPLVVAGPGAGPEVTAAGILNDIQSLAGE
jgi:homoserine dehydrogenase